jgi:hypothetical protein
MAIISLTTIPSRIKNIKKTIDSLLMQQLDIYVWIPRVVKRTGEEFDGKMPTFLKNNSRINVEVVEDMGSITKLIPALDLDEDVIITCDDDIYYPIGWASGLLEAHEKFPKYALCYRGRRFPNRQNKQYGSTKIFHGAEYEFVDIITGVRGALYHKNFFDKKIYNFKNFIPAWFVDDVWISGCLDDRGIKRMCIPNLQASPIKEVASIAPLFSINNWRNPNNNNDAVISHFKWEHV